MEYNNTIHSITKESPHFMVFGQESRLPIDLVIRKDEIDELNPSIEARTAKAVKRIRDNQRYNKEKYDKRRTNETFKRGDFVLWRQEPRTNMALEEHAKLVSPWYGPATIFKDIGQNKYVIIDEESNPKTINVENLKKYQKRPAWMKDDMPEEMEVEGNVIVSPTLKPVVQEEIEIPAIKQVVVPLAKEGENPSNVRRSSREKKYIPEKGDEIDMKFADPKTGKKSWYCGKVTRIDEEDKQNIYCEFLDRLNPGWYDIREEKSEIRRCVPTEEHKRTHKGQTNSIQINKPILSIQESAQNPKNQKMFKE
ncbi:MAG TPA: hypothetical protein VER35_02450 [Candidatus Limnocylindrales bacterium]|nr:hypothetical protein [Candidatus Limnocylindrales bacterium]